MPRSDAVAEKLAAEGAKPEGPVVIAISIRHQSMKVYDSNGLFAQSPVSTGTAGHPTPMGVFSIIEKHKWHRSNIYSGAPMPYMQRITWSGVAMHAGELPGYPASHGCIRMPMHFALKLWHYTRMGARVVVSPDEIAPSDIVHSALASLAPAKTMAKLSNRFVPSAAIKTADASGAILGPSASVMVDVSSTANALQAQSINPRTAATVVDDGAPPAPVNAAPIELPILAPVAEHVAERTLADPSAAGTAAVGEPSTNESQAAPVPLNRTGPVAIFISRNDSRIYLRHKFKPLFDMPIEIAAGDRPIGTHIFTARGSADEATKLLWTAVSLPSSVRNASLHDERTNHRRRTGAVSLPVAPDSTAVEALDRITIPAEVMARLGGALPPGSSVVISDQGIRAGETGDGTDFIVRLR